MRSLGTRQKPSSSSGWTQESRSVTTGGGSTSCQTLPNSEYRALGVAAQRAFSQACYTYFKACIGAASSSATILPPSRSSVSSLTSWCVSSHLLKPSVPFCISDLYLPIPAFPRHALNLCPFQLESTSMWGSLGGTKFIWGTEMI